MIKMENIRLNNDNHYPTPKHLPTYQKTPAPDNRQEVIDSTGPHFWKRYLRTS